ncbi:telethonin [Acipenser oxyrinchus oxyrinchus]|uniref:Telethonin n=1 Tax=Acipenser oxyrinchus oxyrinchus TaxID=40147 RepID=A0AAD8CYK7_ACIOX|nr:telethonin [Acipenser oxyrinchus oxyrinchus]
MHGRSVVVKKAGSVTAAELGCTVKEADPGRKESYTAEWQDLVLSTQPEDRCSVREVNDARKESFHRQHQVVSLFQRSPRGLLRLGTLGGPMTEYQLPYRSVLPLPLFTPAELSGKRGTEQLARDSPTLDGACPTKREISDITRDLPPLSQPFRMDFTKLPRSLGRSMSQEAQRG